MMKSLLATLAGLAALLPMAASAATVEVDLGLTRYPAVRHLDAGSYSGVSEGRVVVHVGDAVVFVNRDADGHHTASALPGNRFPADPRFTDAALRAGGSIGPAAWSTGDLAPGMRSQPIVAGSPGTYLYGCFYDYQAGMRGEIVVEP